MLPTTQPYALVEVIIIDGYDPLAGNVIRLEGYLFSVYLTSRSLGFLYKYKIFLVVLTAPKSFPLIYKVSLCVDK